MNTIISQIKAIINENINTYLPDQKREAFEENGAIYYMNGKNGTEFDWFVNERLSDFFVFYNDEESLGAVKLNLYHNGDVAVYIYDEQGHHMKKEVHTHIKTSEELLLKFAVLLKKTVDDPCVWDADIEKIDTEKEVSEEWMRKKHPLFVSKKLEDSAASVSTAVVSAAEEKKEDQPAAVISATAVVVAAHRTISAAG